MFLVFIFTMYVLRSLPDCVMEIEEYVVVCLGERAEEAEPLGVGESY